MQIKQTVRCLVWTLPHYYDFDNTPIIIIIAIIWKTTTVITIIVTIVFNKIAL